MPSARPSTIRCRRASTRTTRSSSSTTCSSPGRTCWFTATRQDPVASTRAPASCNGYCFQGCTRFAVKLDFIAGLLAQGAARDRRRRVPRQPGDARRDRRLAQLVLVACRTRWRPTRSPGSATRCCRICEPALGLPRLRARRLSAHQGDHREDRRLGADLPAVVGEGFRQSGDRPVPGALCARLERHRLQRAHQDHEAAVGRRSAANSAAATSSTSATTPATRRTSASRR